MKFRCRIVEPTAMRNFMNIVSIVSKIAKQCVMRLTANELCFKTGDDRTLVLWVELLQSHFFTEYVMSGVCEEQNEIYLEFDSAMLARTIASLRSTAKYIKIKLTNKRQPCVTFELELPSSTLETRQCVHDVPVRVIPRKEWPEYCAPNIPEFDVSIDMPQLKHVRNVVDRMKNMNARITVSADKTGKFVLSVETDVANVSTYFEKLSVWSCSQIDSDDSISAMIDVKRFLLSLTWESLHPDSVRCNILQDKMVNLFLDVRGYLKIRYFIPAIVT